MEKMSCSINAMGRFENFQQRQVVRQRDRQRREDEENQRQDVAIQQEISSLRNEVSALRIAQRNYVFSQLQ